MKRQCNPSLPQSSLSVLCLIFAAVALSEIFVNVALNPKLWCSVLSGGGRGGGARQRQYLRHYRSLNPQDKTQHGTEVEHKLVS